MSYTASAYQVMIASPRDVTAERKIIQDVIHEWNAVNSVQRKAVLLPVAWETHSAPEMGNRPQGVINQQILSDCDLLIGVFWTRLGTDTGDFPSGTVEEIERHLEAGKPAMIYFSDQPVVPSSVDADQYQKLQRFREHCLTRGLCEQFTDIPDFQEKFRRQLHITINKNSHFQEGNISGDTPPFVDNSPSPRVALPEKSKKLLLEAINDQHGVVLSGEALSGLFIQTNRKAFVENASPMEEAEWREALKGLTDQGLLEQGEGGEVFRVTAEGFRLAKQFQ